MTKHSKIFTLEKEKLEKKESQLLEEMNVETGKLQSIALKALLITGGVLLISGIGYSIFRFIDDGDGSQKKKKKKREPKKATGFGDKIADKVVDRAVEVATSLVTKLIDSRFPKRS